MTVTAPDASRAALMFRHRDPSAGNCVPMTGARGAAWVSVPPAPGQPQHRLSTWCWPRPRSSVSTSRSTPGQPGAGGWAWVVDRRGPRRAGTGRQVTGVHVQRFLE
jgi:hypothetical protein